MIRRAEEATPAGTAISLRRMVAVVARANWGPVWVASARVRLNAITASMSQAAFAANLPEARQVRQRGALEVGVDPRPLLFAALRQEVRRAHLNVFPREVWYLVHEELQLVEVVALVHDRQDPSLLATRLT
jgi:hypothetical protein